MPIVDSPLKSQSSIVNQNRWVSPIGYPDAQLGTRMIGFIMTISNIGGITAGLLLGRITRVMKRFTLVFVLGFLALGFVLLNFVDVVLTFAISCAIWGVGFGVFIPGIAIKVIGSVPKSASTRALAILSFAMGIGQFISPRVYTYINRMLGLEGPRASWTVAAFGFAAAFVVSLAATIKSSRNALPANN
jgi:MFS family permease